MAKALCVMLRLQRMLYRLPCFKFRWVEVLPRKKVEDNVDTDDHYCTQQRLHVTTAFLSLPCLISNQMFHVLGNLDWPVFRITQARNFKFEYKKEKLR